MKKIVANWRFVMSLKDIAFKIASNPDILNDPQFQKDATMELTTESNVSSFPVDVQVIRSLISKQPVLLRLCADSGSSAIINGDWF